MAKRTVTVKLESPVEWFGKFLSEVVLREPTAGEFIDLGEPQIWARSADGGIFAIEQGGAIKQYLDKCLKVENGSDIFLLLSLKDGKAIKGALLSFFSDAAEPQTLNNDGASSPST